MNRKELKNIVKFELRKNAIIPDLHKKYDCGEFLCHQL